MNLINQINTIPKPTWQKWHRHLRDAPSQNPTQAKDLWRGMRLKFASILFYAVLAGLVKQLSGKIPVGEIVFCRSFFSFIPLALVIKINGGFFALRTRHFKRHLWRSLSGMGGMYCGFAAIAMMPLADATALQFLTPILTALLAWWMLGEHLPKTRMVALLVSLAGMVMILHPGAGDVMAAGHQMRYIFGVILSLAAAVFAAFAMIAVRQMTHTEPGYRIVSYLFATTSVVGLVSMFFDAAWPSPTDAILLVLCGVFGGIAQILMTLSFRYAPTALMSAMDYSLLVTAVLTGYFFFGEIPSGLTLAGSLVVVASGIGLIYDAKKRQE
ncbi:MAG: DMT family transporter [Candidatus Symbiobacter sp.]|nr:DMT family transporter [Candidatus Symbiobacter sp.]